jgi:hypothetical protein
MKTVAQSCCILLMFAQAAVAQLGGAGGAGVGGSSKQTPKQLRDWVPSDGRKNANGMKPWKERLPPLKRIADPANLQSKNPAIKAAAEIKAQEDLKCQKIKALRYLATVGCGCYNEDGKITEAILASLTDCTEEVRMATVELVQTAASKGRCKNCNQFSCCNEDVVKKLAEMAYELDDKGCPIEPSAEIRAAACKAMKACCPNQAPPMELLPTEPPKELEIEGGEMAPETGEVPQPESVPQNSEPSTPMNSADSETGKPVGGEKFRQAGEPIRPISQSEVEGVAKVARTANLESVVRSISTDRPLGKIDSFNTDEGTVLIKFDSQIPSKGCRVVVYHRHTLGRISASCEMEVIGVEGQMITARPANGASAFPKMCLGDLVVGLP